MRFSNTRQNKTKCKQFVFLYRYVQRRDKMSKYINTVHYAHDPIMFNDDKDILHRTRIIGFSDQYI